MKDKTIGGQKEQKAFVRLVGISNSVLSCPQVDTSAHHVERPQVGITENKIVKLRLVPTSGRTMKERMSLNRGFRPPKEVGLGKLRQTVRGL